MKPQPELKYTMEPFFPRFLREKGWVPHAANGPVARAALNAPSAKAQSMSEPGGVKGWIDLLKSVPGRDTYNALVLGIARREFEAGRIISFCRKSAARKGVAKVTFGLLPPADAELGEPPEMGRLSQLEIEVDIGEVLALAKVYRERDTLEKASATAQRQATTRKATTRKTPEIEPESNTPPRNRRRL